MKILTVLLSLMLTLTSSASEIHPTAVTVTAQVSSTVMSETLVIPKGAKQINPVVVTFKGDSAYSVSWVVNKITSDTTVDSYGEVYLNGKQGYPIVQFGITIPKAIINSWGLDNSSIDDFIFKLPEMKRFVRK
ncbi:MAG: hypothetical protein HYU71_06410 [Bacteroidetes bacterium]|nr:hypothetical protein [Bacteroidota bacterium]